MIHCSGVLVFGVGMRYTAPNAVDEAILNTHLYGDVIMQPTPKKKESETSSPMEKQPTESHPESSLDKDSHLMSKKK